MAKNLVKLTMADIDSPSSQIIEDFITADSDQNPKNIPFDTHPFSIDGIALALCLKGEGEFSINFKQFTIKENTLICILPGQIVEKIHHSDDFYFKVLSFSPSYLDNITLPKELDILSHTILDPISKLTEEDVHNLLRHYTFIIDTFKESKHLHIKEIIRGLLYSLLVVVASLYARSESEEQDKITSRGSEIVDGFINLLRVHYKEERTAAFYASELCISTKYLSATLKKVTGRTVNIWIEEAIIMGAKAMLKSSDLSVIQISEEMNFPNPSYFGRFFKKATGMTPKEYRDS